MRKGFIVLESSSRIRYHPERRLYLRSFVLNAHCVSATVWRTTNVTRAKTAEVVRV